MCMQLRFVVEKNGELKLGQYACTVLARTSSGCVAVRYQSREKALKQALGTRKAEVGIASFTDKVEKIDVWPDRRFITRCRGRH